jgi:Tol biopolymer transport system component
MGEVYRARDPRLERDVAIKVLPPLYWDDSDRLRRFEQEAKAAGALNHPNITAIYDIGTHDGSPYVVQELLDGETLRSVLAGGRLSAKRTIDYALQIAHGLAAAHEKGIVHRDLKPENLFVTRAGRVKILDFGLAKLTRSEPRIGPESKMPTETAGTEPGVVLGTLGYMSPEQVRGQAADARSDIFSFGTILYEMLSGRRAFRGDSAADTMSAILKEEPPDISTTNQTVPRGLERIVRHCLEKGPEQRFHSAHDLAFDLETLTGISGAEAAQDAPYQRRLPARLWPLLAAAAVASAVILALGVFLGRRSLGPNIPSFHQVTWRRGTIVSARFAPDGQTILYSASWDGNPPTTYIKRPESYESVPLDLPACLLLAISPSGELALQLKPTWAQWGLVSRGTLARAPMTGGAPREVVEDINQADWGPDGRIVVARDAGGRGHLEFPPGKILYETAGTVTAPRFSPRGDLIAFVDHSIQNDASGVVAVIDLRGNKKTLTKEGPDPIALTWSPSGDEIWFDTDAIYAVTLSGQQRRIASRAGGFRVMDMARSGRVLLSLDHNTYRVKGLAPGDPKERELSWFDGTLVYDLSSNGRTVVLDEQGEAGGSQMSVCMRNMDGSPVVRLGDGMAGPLSPDGKWVVSQLLKPGAPLVLLPTGPGDSKQIDSAGLNVTFSFAWLPDGKRLVFTAREAARGTDRLYVQSVEDGKPRPISPEGIGGKIEGLRGGIAVSPDGRFVAAVGPDRKIALYPIDGGDARAVPGAFEEERPLQWSDDGKSLYVSLPRELFSPAHVFKLNIETGKRTLTKELRPEDPAGFVAATHVCITPDGRSYVYDYIDVQSDLYVAEGLK